MLTNKNIYRALFIIFFAVASNAEACSGQNRYWVAANDGNEKLWHDNANWSCSSGGSGGASAPNSTNRVAIFNGGSTVDAKLGQNLTKLKNLKFIMAIQELLT